MDPENKISLVVSRIFLIFQKLSGRVYVNLLEGYIYIYTYGQITLNYNISLTKIKPIWGWFLLLTIVPVRSQWGRYNLPIYIYIYIHHMFPWYLTIPPLIFLVAKSSLPEGPKPGGASGYHPRTTSDLHWPDDQKLVMKNGDMEVSWNGESPIAGWFSWNISI